MAIYTSIATFKQQFEHICLGKRANIVNRQKILSTGLKETKHTTNVRQLTCQQISQQSHTLFAGKTYSLSKHPIQLINDQWKQQAIHQSHLYSTDRLFCIMYVEILDPVINNKTDSQPHFRSSTRFSGKIKSCIDHS